jgi:hypothetical protein
VIGILISATTVRGIFVTIDWRHVWWIFIEVRAAYSEILAVRVYPVPQFFVRIPSLGISRAVHTHEIGRKPVAITAAQASTMV